MNTPHRHTAVTTGALDIASRPLSRREALLGGAGLCLVASSGSFAHGRSAKSPGARLDDLWARRDTPGANQEALDWISRDETAPSILWRKARLHYWIADLAKVEDKEDLGRSGYEAGQRAALAVPNQAAAWYWAAACVGPWADGAGWTTALTEGLATRFEEAIHRANELDPTVDRGGPPRALGRFYSTIPWPFRRLTRAKAYLSEALQIESNSAATRLFMAETLIAMKDSVGARQHLDALLALDPHSGDAPARRRWQPHAQALVDSLS